MTAKKKTGKGSTLPTAATPMNINEAWNLLAQSGTASQYLGRLSDGRHQVALTNPQNGLPLSIGRGPSVVEAIGAALRDAESFG